MSKTSFASRYYPWIVWLIAAGFFFYKYLVQVSPSVMTHDLMRTFHVHGAGLGNLSAFYFYAYLCMQVPVGLLLDKYSPRLLTTSAIMLCSISTLLFSQTSSLEWACVNRALMGAGAAFAAVSCFKLAAVWFAPQRFALVSGLFMTAAMLGAIGGQMPLSLLVQYTDWRIALKIVGLTGMGLGVIYFLVIRDKPLPQSQPQPIKPDDVRYSLLNILKNKQAWLLSLYSGLAFAPVSVFGGLWGVPFLETAHALTKTEAALATSSIFVGFAIGAPLLGWLSDFLGRRKPILYAGTSLALCSLTLVLYCNPLPLPWIILLGCFGFSASGFFTSFAMIRELFPLFLVATILGIMNTFDALCEALFEPLVGAILDATWSGATSDGIHHFSLQSYHTALLVFPLTLLLALVSLFFIKETYCQGFGDAGKKSTVMKSKRRMPSSNCSTQSLSC